MPKPSEEAVAKAMIEGTAEFTRLHLQARGTARLADRFYFEDLGDGDICISFGSARVLGDPLTGTATAFVSVAGTFAVDATLLQNLADAIQRQFPKDPPASH